MRTPESWLRQITSLRLKATALAKAGRWPERDTVQQKIIKAWAGYHRAVELQNLDRETKDRSEFKFRVIETTDKHLVSRHRTMKSAAANAARLEKHSQHLGGKYKVEAIP